MDYVRVKFGGILGCDFLFRNFCLIDCGARQIYFRSAKPSDSESKALEETLRQSGFAEVNLKWRNGLAVEAAANGQPLLLLVDTGATWSVLDDSQVPRLQLKTVQEGNPKLGTLIPEDLSAEIIGFGKIGAHQMRVTTLQTLQIGARIWKDVHVGVANLKAWGISEPGKAVEIQGLFGAEMLAARGALIDFASEKLWLRPEKSTKPGARSP